MSIFFYTVGFLIFHILTGMIVFVAYKWWLKWLRKYALNTKNEESPAIFWDIVLNRTRPNRNEGILIWAILLFTIIIVTANIIMDIALERIIKLFKMEKLLSFDDEEGDIYWEEEE